MKVSLNWAKEFVDLPLEVDTIIEKIGSQLGAVEDVQYLGKKYKGILIVKVVSCLPHPNAERLKVCLIDDGRKAKGVKRDSNGLVQVICGAPNVQEGMMAAWLPPGTIVPSSYFEAEPFKLEKRDLRGQTSYGMLASPKELALGDSHEGLLVVDYEAPPGSSFANVYRLDDYIIDIENKMFTHRPDCFGILGVAREIAGICGLKFTSPAWYQKASNKLTPQGEALPIKVDNKLPDLVPRFMAVVIKNVKVAPSPVWFQTFLSRVGVRPINNIVDMTNYMMLVSGQPLHAYDYDKVRSQDLNNNAATLVVRHPTPREKLRLIGGKEVGLESQDIVIATASKAIGLGGIMGGASTEVDEHTKNIILECATFNMYTIRRSSMSHGLFTDAVTRFSKGQSPLQNDRIITKCASMIIDTSPIAAESASDLVDLNHVKASPKPVMISLEFINQRLGLSLNAKQIKTILENVEFGVSINGSKLTVSIPFWRTDIEIPEDIVEEVGRLYGYDHLSLQLPRRSLAPAAPDNLLTTKSRIRELLVGAGANEILSYSFVHKRLLESANQDTSQAYQIANAISPDLQFYRLSLTPSLGEKVYPNLRSDMVRGNDNEFVLFELNKSHNKVNRDKLGLPMEHSSMALIFAADAKTANRKYQGAAFFVARKYLAYVLGPSNLLTSLTPLSALPRDEVDQKGWVQQLIKPFDPARSAVIKDELGKIRGVIGEYQDSFRRSLKLPPFCSGFEIDIGLFENAMALKNYEAVPVFPKVDQDLTIRLPNNILYSDIFEFIYDQIDKARPANTYFRLMPLDIFQKDKDIKHQQLSFRIWISSFDRTLTTEVVNNLLDKASAAAKEKYGASRV